MKKLILTALISMGFVLCNANAWAGLVTPNNSGTPNQVYQDINYVFNQAGLSSYATLTSNADANSYEYTGSDSYWKELAPAGSSAAVAEISIGAANTNTLGVFKEGSSVPSSINYITPPETGLSIFLGTGTNSNPFPGSIATSGTNGGFGFALQTVSHYNGQPSYWYSDSTLNSDSQLHMLAYSLPQLAGTTFYVNNGSTTEPITLGSDTYLLAWEDSNGGGDFDYKDSVMLVTNVIPAPEPMTLVLFAVGVIALFGFAWRKRLAIA
ncbi:MAG: PEP-CTERM sorting domain-containing protein [Candidatus Omnitrophica bacterium]|nr:PEP-CTERM sorting domain-containing protein [Candidatus Omnitrophota bacterium]